MVRKTRFYPTTQWVYGLVALHPAETMQSPSTGSAKPRKLFFQLSIRQRRQSPTLPRTNSHWIPNVSLAAKTTSEIASRRNRNRSIRETYQRPIRNFRVAVSSTWFITLGWIVRRNSIPTSPPTTNATVFLGEANWGDEAGLMRETIRKERRGGGGGGGTVWAQQSKRGFRRQWIHTLSTPQKKPEESSAARDYQLRFQWITGKSSGYDEVTAAAINGFLHNQRSGEFPIKTPLSRSVNFERGHDPIITWAGPIRSHSQAHCKSPKTEEAPVRFFSTEEDMKGTKAN